MFEVYVNNECNMTSVSRDFYLQHMNMKNNVDFHTYSE